MDFAQVKKDYYRKILIIGVPVVIQNLIGMGLNLIDTLMIGKLGEAELAAVGAANQLYFIFSVSLFGLLSGAAVYTAQYWGTGNIDGIRKLIGIDYTISLIVTFLFTAIAFILPEMVIRFFSDDSSVISLGVSYLRIAAISYIFTAISTTISYNSRAIQRLMIPTVVNLIALVINAGLNYILIFGKLGAPALGVRGAAIATLTARVFETIALLVMVYGSKEHPFKTSIKNTFSYGAELFGRVIKTAIPVLLTEFGWAISVALIFAAYGRLGTSSLAVAQIANVISELLQSVFFGIGNATMVIIGERLGRGERDEAYFLGTHSIKVVIVVGVVITAFFMLISKPITGIYDFSIQTNALLISTLLAQAALILPKMVGYILVIGILRAGGDTFFSFIFDFSINLFYQASMAFFAVLVLKVSLPIAVLLVGTGEIIRILIFYPRYRSKKWLRTVID